MARKFRCIGDDHNIECPHCGRQNHYVCQGTQTKFGTISPFCRPCALCGQMVYYLARYEIAVVAEKTDFLSMDTWTALEAPLLKKYELVFRDVLVGSANKPEARIFWGVSEEELVLRLGLVKCKYEENRYAYWDGKNGEVLIFINEVGVEQISTEGELHQLVQELHAKWS